MKSAILILLFAFVSIFIAFNEEAWKNNMYCSDMLGYYMYLPTVFIYHDLDAMKLLPEADKNNIPAVAGTEPFDIAKTTWRVNKYPIGVAIFELPFFLAAYAWIDNVPGDLPDGYSIPFQLAGIFSNIFWSVAGLFALRKFLKLFFSENTVAITLACIAFGTNLYCYTAFSYGMSHPYVFFLFSCILYHTAQFYKLQRAKHLLMLGLLIGMVFITRNIDIVFIAIIPALWGIHNLQTLKERFGLFYLKRQALTISLLIFCFIALIQVSLWKYTSGHWLYDSYQGEGFNFLKPHILQGLFGFRKGWFVYSPVVIAGVIGLIFLVKANGNLASAFITYFIITVYIVFSWKNWWYGGGFGARALIESLAPLALPFGYFVRYVLNLSKRFYTIVLLFVLSCCITLNIFQTYQYSTGIIHCDRMTYTYYLKIFGETEIKNKNYERYLLREEDYWE